ncbi:MAG: hypothetical protein FJY55_10415 [Betaproteobacteria bacterium]|nr:hypothetical protein [Betaproteobacteria bacterium]
MEYRRGDAISTGNPAVKSVVIARHSAPDDAFGGGRIAYRYDAQTVLWTLGYSRPLGPRDSLDFSWWQANSSPLLSGTFTAPGGIYGAAGTPVTVGRSRYTSNLLSAAWLTRF